MFFKKKKLEFDKENMPKHIAFICDGNRRWAEMRGMPPLLGHQAGISNFENLYMFIIFLGSSFDTTT